jgi:hypothetical protein
MLGTVAVCSQINKNARTYSLGRMYSFLLFNLLVHQICFKRLHEKKKIGWKGETKYPMAFVYVPYTYFCHVCTHAMHVYVWYMEYSVWYMVNGVWCMVYGICCMVYGVWCLVYGVWYMVNGVWCMVYGEWCLVYGIW